MRPDDLSYFSTPEFQEILRKYETMLAGDVSVVLDADELTDLAEYYEWVVHDTEKSRKVIDYALTIHPDAIDPAIFKARGFMMEDNLDEASRCADAISDQTDREVCFLQAEILLRKNRRAEALRLLYQRMSEQSEMDLFLYDAAFILVDYRAYQEAHALAGVLEKMAPHWFKTFEVMAAINIGLEHYEEVLPYTRHMLEIDVFFDIAWENKAEALIGLQRYKEAQECINYLLALKPNDFHALEMKAEVLMNAFNPEAAHLLYVRLIAINDIVPDLYLNDAYCLLQLGLYFEALSQLQIAEQLFVPPSVPFPPSVPSSPSVPVNSQPAAAGSLSSSTTSSSPSLSSSPVFSSLSSSFSSPSFPSLFSDPFFVHIQIVKATLLSKLHRPEEALAILNALASSTSVPVNILPTSAGIVPSSPSPFFSSTSLPVNILPAAAGSLSLSFSPSSPVFYSSLLCIRAKIYAEAGREEEARIAFNAYRRSPNIPEAQACYNFAIMLLDAERYQWALDIFNEIPDSAVSQLDMPNPQGSILLYKMICYHNLSQLKPMLDCLKGCIENPVDYFESYFSHYISENLPPQAYYDHYSSLPF